jgi:hypothetical protein
MTDYNMLQAISTGSPDEIWYGDITVGTSLRCTDMTRRAWSGYR